MRGCVKKTVTCAVALVLTGCAFQGPSPATPHDPASTGIKPGTYTSDEWESTEKDMQGNEDQNQPVLPGGEEDQRDAIRSVTPGYMNRVAKEAGVEPKEVRYCLVDDFDLDGQAEGFFYVGEADSREVTGKGTIWFANENECRMIDDPWQYVMYGDTPFYVIEAGSRDFICFDESFPEEVMTSVYYIDDGSTLCRSMVSRWGDFAPCEDGGYVCKQSAIDLQRRFEKGKEAEEKWSGTTHKPYYFYFDDELKDFSEIKSRKISAEEMKEKIGMDLAKEIEEAGYELGEIYLRENGLLQVNYHQTKQVDDMMEVTYGNATFDTKQGRFVNAASTGDVNWQESNLGGSYRLSLTRDFGDAEDANVH